MEKSKNKFKIWETALLLAVCITVLIGIWAQGQQQELSSKLIRLHVIASSDSEEDQELKLAVRDRVLEVLAPSLEGTQDVGEAAEIISGKLDLIENAAAETVRENGREYDVSVELGTEDYPTKQYEGFALPAGEYTSLRVVLGEGEGHNWWCVVFPPLCLSAAEVTSGGDGYLSDADVALITEDSTGYIIKFKLLEIWGNMMEKIH
jgi:stage II sporulation protein R